MRWKLERLLRIRMLLEEAAQFELEKKRAEMCTLERAREEQRRLALSVRQQALEVLNSPERSTGDEWCMRITDADLLGWKRRKLAAAMEGRRPAVEAATRDFLARRVERRQMAALAALAAERGKRESLRTAQRQLDDWFHGRALRRERD